ncbi:response regulator transcription factor [Streptomyces sp. NPDC005438]|uniref:response regulator transcription factor n=1 Tax=Streptomyces sp. NPDC005438 TaxID=3156880 RepID=UPI0033AB0BC5
MIRIAVVDDDRMLLGGLRSWLAEVPEIDLVATGSTVPELLAALDRPPQVVLLDMVLRDDSTPASNVAALRASGSRVLLISAFPDRSRIVAGMRAGADGYLTKDHDLPAVVTAVREITEGGTLPSRELAFALARDDSPNRPSLAPKELQVLLDYASGLTLKATARRVGISPNTAKDYLDRVKAKYRQAGRPTYTKTDLIHRVREDGLT